MKEAYKSITDIANGLDGLRVFMGTFTPFYAKSVNSPSTTRVAVFVDAENGNKHALYAAIARMLT